jgi:hypothetical protein
MGLLDGHEELTRVWISESSDTPMALAMKNEGQTPRYAPASKALSIAGSLGYPFTFSDSLNCRVGTLFPPAPSINDLGACPR